VCGITGFLGRVPHGAPIDALCAMTDAIAHRGPDADGHWVDDEAGIALGHRRLSIIDLSADGAQPMTAASGRYVIVFNGEAYNFAPLREELAAGGYPFRGHSDTEVLLAAFDRWGIAAAIPRFAGMFAMGIWDRAERSLTLVRDRLGEKPLYFGRVGGAWLFGSELKALRRFPGWQATTSPQAVAQLLRHGYIQAPLSIHAEVRKLEPGAMVVLRVDGSESHHRYWDAEAAARAGLADPIIGSDDEIADALDAVLRPIVRDEMVADVPLGAFLSGGVDSSLIVALMQAQSARPIRTFTIGFDDPRFDEATFAKQVAAHLGTEHTELRVDGDDALALVPRLAEIYDEPMADSSQLPTLLVSRLTRRHVTVAVSGDGGDELFGGYPHYRNGGTIARLRARAPGAVRALAGAALLRVPDPAPELLVRRLTSGDEAIGSRPSNALTRLGAMLASSGEFDVYRSTLAQTVVPSRLLTRDFARATGEGLQEGPWLGDDRTFPSRMLFDTLSYLPDDVLVKVDRAAMACSLETRAPLLDHRVFEFAWRIPHSAKVRDGVGKLPLRRLLFRHVPRDLVDRPKRGFAVPLATWLRGALREWAESLLDPRALRETGVLDPVPVRRLWQHHLDGLANNGDRLWTICSLAAFLQGDRAASPARSASPA
jgi:asparagine synthase (glutamine-hydrolysing)